MSRYDFAMHTTVASGSGTLTSLQETVGGLAGSRRLIVGPAISEARIPTGRVRERLPGSVVFDGARPDPDVGTVLATLRTEGGA